MAKTYELKATVRDRVGKGAARALRREGLVPAVIYGDKKAPVAIAVPEKETTAHLYAGGFLTHVATIDVNGEKIQVIPRDYALDPVRDFLIHVDFLRVSATSRIRLEVPFHFVNQDASAGLKRGGTLNIVHHEIELEVSADSIPEHIEIDLSTLDIGESIALADIKLPAGAVVLSHDKDFSIASIIGKGGEG